MIELKETYTPLMGFKLEKGTEGIFILEKGSEFVKIAPPIYCVKYAKKI